ncbi:hypothetical protein [Nonlabens sp.]|uniref:OB-fold protein n=1 Tax=Nonlabens sp. TaxID=1888209 RepID=UPI001BCF695B|nr:hypothetical protein [Nonlabens sp.]
MKKIVLIVFFIIVILGILGYNYLYQDHRDVVTSNATASYTSSELIDLFTDQDSANDTDALDQVIEVSGVATATSTNSITLDGQVFIEFNTPHKVALNQTYTLKGRCLGYDDLLEEIKIDQAIVINPSN